MIVCVQLSVGGINFPFTLAREFNVVIINAHAATWACIGLRWPLVLSGQLVLSVQKYHGEYSRSRHTNISQRF